jgi:hypothetical protein
MLCSSDIQYRTYYLQPYKVQWPIAYDQRFGHGFNGSRIRIKEGKNDPEKKEGREKILCFASARGFLWAVGISCSLRPFPCGLRIKILQIKKNPIFFYL